MEIYLECLEYIKHILLYQLIYKNGASCAVIRYTGSDILYQEVCNDFKATYVSDSLHLQCPFIDNILWKSDHIIARMF